jgi:hypothetical protein
VARVLAIRDGGEGGGGPWPPPEEAMAMDAQVRNVAPVSAPPPVQPGVSTRQVQIRVDFALSK